MMSKIRVGFAVAMVGALAACHSGVKLDEGANANKGPVAQTDQNAVQQVNVDPLNDPKSHPERHVLIQGNTDERGTSEYNLALGQKRAEAVRRSMSLLGVADTQMEAVSLGKEKPQAPGHDEASWAQNRRADLAYQQ
jgi:peptidoglycan-associated lipoprotein